MIGVISDTHDNKDAIMEAIRILNEEGVKIVIHAGDHISPFSVRWMKKLNSKVYGVAGNNDGETTLLKKLYDESGWVFRDFLLEVDINGKRIVVNHGTYEEVVNALISSGRYDIVIHGHTHEVRIENIGNTLVLNPGEACGYLTDRRTIALLDTINLDVRIIEF
jgi:putative phosphoesterase